MLEKGYALSGKVKHQWAEHTWDGEIETSFR
jgi:hypothetical protein